MKYTGLAYVVIAFLSFMVLWAINGFFLPMNADDLGIMAFLVVMALFWPLTILFILGVTKR